MKSLIAFALAGALVTPAAAAAPTGQEVIEACTDEQSLQQVIDSNGQITPEDCMPISLSALTTQGDRLCLIDLAPGGSGVLGKLQDVARASKYWVRCSALSDAVAAQGG